MIFTISNLRRFGTSQLSDWAKVLDESFLMHWNKFRELELPNLNFWKIKFPLGYKNTKFQLNQFINVVFIWIWILKTLLYHLLFCFKMTIDQDCKQEKFFSGRGGKLSFVNIPIFSFFFFSKIYEFRIEWKIRILCSRVWLPMKTSDFERQDGQMLLPCIIHEIFVLKIIASLSLIITCHTCSCD